MSKHREPTPKLQWHQHRVRLHTYLTWITLWMREQRTDIADIITEIKRKNK